MTLLYDELTLKTYSQQAKRFASMPVTNRAKSYLRAFMDKMPPGGSVLDLGCGSGWAAMVMSRHGFDAYAIDGVPELAQIASSKMPRPATAARFDELEAPEMFDGVFACDALHYVPRSATGTILGMISQVLKPGGILFASFKEGQGEYRDSEGRLYACYQPDGLTSLVNGSSGLQYTSIKTDFSPDLTGDHRIFLGLHCRRSMQVWR
jgi:2-polyprenyl-3-methyl-5-hydroxy-6-metoxy-1,4-benzoquinol methylase